jgi:RNA polymerase sigma-70 factor, ECF subfamily
MTVEQTPRSDGDLARESQAGSLAAFEELVYRYERRVYAFVNKCCRCEADAVDLTQETFVKAFQAISQYNPRFAFASWLFTIARRKCIDRFRAQPPEPEALVPTADELPDPSEQLARAEDSSALWNLAARKLPAAQYEALWLRYAGDLSIDEIARVVRKTKTHVKVLLFRARQALGRELEAVGQGRGTRLAAHGSAGRLSESAHVVKTELPRAAPGRLGFSLAGRTGLS